MKNSGLLHPTELIAVSDTVQQAVFVAGTGQAFDVPAGSRYCSFAPSLSLDFWVRYGSTAASIPTTSSTGSSTNSELNPSTRNIVSTAVTTGISVISATTGYLTISWWN